MIARRMTCKHFFPAMPFKKLVRITIRKRFRMGKNDPIPRFQDDAIRVIQARVEEDLARIVKDVENGLMLEQRGKMTGIDIIEKYISRTISSSGSPIFLPAANAFEPHMSKARAKVIEAMKAGRLHG